MSILTRQAILDAMKAGHIKIEPFNEQYLGPASMDLTLSNKFRIYKKAIDVVDVVNGTDYKDYSELIETETMVISPGATILGITEEVITLTGPYCGWLEGRSSFARLGLMVHISASFMQPGIANRQVLEITNLGPVPMRLHAGTQICQFIFQTTLGEADYTGRFEGQMEP